MLLRDRSARQLVVTFVGDPIHPSATSSGRICCQDTVAPRHQPIESGWSCVTTFIWSIPATRAANTSSDVNAVVEVRRPEAYALGPTWFAGLPTFAYSPASTVRLHLRVAVHARFSWRYCSTRTEFTVLWHRQSIPSSPACSWWLNGTGCSGA